MGSWNHTCFVSNLPITVGDEVVVAMLQNNARASEYMTPTTYWAPAPVFFYGKYDDYGGVDDCHGSQLEYILDEFRENLVEREGETIGKTTTRGKISRKNFGAAELFRADHGDHLQMVTPSGFRGALAGEKDPYLQVKHTVIRQEVFDKLLERYYWDEYVGPDEPYRQINYEYLCGQIPDYIRILTEYFDPENQQKQFTIQFHPLPEIEWKHPNNLAKHAEAYVKSHVEFFRKSFANKIQLLVEGEKFDDLEELLREFAKYVILYMCMRDSRRCFIRPTGSSQEIETVTQRMLAEITIEAGIEMDKEHDENYDGAWDPVRQLYMEQCKLDF